MRKHRIPPTPFAAWLEGMLVKKHITAQRLAGRLHLDPHRVMAWRDGTLPGPQMCVKLAEFFHIPLAEVYMMAQIPLKAPWEMTPEDWYFPPDIDKPSPSE